MAKMLIPRVTPEMFKNYPDQCAEILNRVIDYINSLPE